MARKPKLTPKKGEPTQTTEKGFEIPIPKRSAFLRNVNKTIKTPSENSTGKPRSRRV